MTTQAPIVKRAKDEKSRSSPTRGNTGKLHASKMSRSVSPSRRAAFEILRRVGEEGAFASVLLATEVDLLRADDRALCHELVLGVLRRRLWLDKLIENYAGRDAKTIDTGVLCALRIGLYQLRFLSRVPASAAVNESVNLAHEFQMRSAAGFINAVLRHATREPQFDPTTSAKGIEKFSIETSHPAWLLERWIKNFGFDETAKLARANNDAPPISFRFMKTVPSFEFQVPSSNTPSSNPQCTANPQSKDLELETWNLELSDVAPGAWRVRSENGEVRARVRALAHEGLIYLQDEASQLVAHILDAKAGERVLDVCAAPGSKTTHIAARAHNAALVFAGDRSAERLRVLTLAAARQKLKSVCALVFDAEAALPFADETFDRVLVDAPCSGTGTLRRNPEIRWRITNLDINDLAQRQRRILSNAARAVRRYGTLVYSTCSLEREENEEVAAWFLREHQDFTITKLNVAARFLTEDGKFARTFPQRDDVDGFFVAAFARAT